MEPGILLVDKKTGITSHDVVARLRKITGIKKIGHAGTLDPFATGLLIMLIGRPATKLSADFLGLDKTYDVVFRIGVATDTLDRDGVVRYQRAVSISDVEERLGDVVTGFIGEIEQIPPMYSAVKVKGKKLYQLARKGIEIERKSRSVRVHSIEVGEVAQVGAFVDVSMYVSCSSGTYIRTLCADIAVSLGYDAYVTELRRSSIGDYSVNDSVAFDSLDQSVIEQNLLSLPTNG